jgi:hypothetical protein
MPEMDPVERLIHALLYEGYVLWPYRRSAMKNRQRWTFGGVYPRAFNEAHPDDPWIMQTECLVLGAAPTLTAQVRFLQIVERRVARAASGATPEFVDELRVGPERYLAWDEATERTVVLDGLRLRDLRGARVAPISIAAGGAEEPLREAGSADSSRPAGWLMRRWEALSGTVEVEARPAAENVFRLTVRITNTTPVPSAERSAALRRTFASTHSLLRVGGGEFASLTDPPAALRPLAGGCVNRHTWPVLVGTEGRRDTLLSAPIILPDYPQVAPESPGDLFDGTEIDQLLRLSILGLTDEEHAEMRASDPRGREILERTEALTEEDFMRLHGAIRDFRRLDGDPEARVRALERRSEQRVVVGGVEIRPGSRVRLRPRSGADVMDLVLADRVAIVSAIEEDYEERVHLAVTIEDDPGSQLGREGMPGHRFYFSPEEVEPLQTQHRADEERGAGSTGDAPLHCGEGPDADN